VQDDGERLEERALGVGNIGGKPVAISRRVRFVALDGAVGGVDARELDVLAEVVSALCAEEAGVAWHARFNCYTVAWMGVLE